MRVVQVVASLLVACVLQQCAAQGFNTGPTFDKAAYVFNFIEESPIGSFVGQLSATDQDGDNLTYSLVPGVTAALFSIDSSSGIISADRVLDREDRTLDYIDFDASVRDTSNAVVSVRVTIILSDINDNPPIFLNLPATVIVAENSVIGHNVFTVQASDDDQGLNKLILYNITISGMSADSLFTIDSGLGRIDVSSTLDYDIPGGTEHILTVIARDRPFNESQTLTAVGTLTVQVRDINDQLPAFLQTSYQEDVFENITMGEEILTVSARDQDEGISDSILYDISDGNSLINGVPSFSINETSGLIIVNVPQLDRELYSNYSLTVQASERSSPINRAFAIVEIDVFDINDHFPVFDEGLYETAIDENVRVNFTVVTVMASDNDEGLHAEFEYSLLDVNPSTAGGNLPFMVVPSSIMTGGADIILTKELDYENVNERFFRFMVVATEVLGDGLRNGTAVVEVTVRNLNDHNPVFEQLLYTATIQENEAASTFIATVVARDGDAGSFGQLQYSIVVGNDGNMFNITILSDNTALIATTQQLNYEVAREHVLTVRVEDLADNQNNRRFNTTTVEVTVENVNDISPVFVDENGIQIDFVRGLTVQEELLNPVTVYQLEVIDGDGDLNELNFNISSGNSLGAFTIDQERRLINTTTVFNFDRSTPNVNSYSLLVIVSDSSFTDSITVEISVTDINDNSPVFSNETYSFPVEENTAIGTSVGQVSAVDNDSGTFGQVEYSLAGPSQMLRFFWIDSITGELYIREPINREETAGPLQLMVIASDLDVNTPQSDIANITIYVMDLNDNDPSFNETSYSFSVAENTDQLVGLAVFATDPDLGSNSDIVYFITDGNEENAFVLDPETGIISRNATYTIDFESVRSYSLTISAEDQGSPSRDVSVSVLITIMDENDNSPRFSANTFSTSIREDTPAGTSVIRLDANDRDSGEFGRLVYNITVEGPTNFLTVNGTFVIPDNSVGIIFTAGTFDREQFEGPYIVTVNVNDNGMPPNYGSTILNVMITDANDNSPMIRTDEVRPPIDEEQGPGIHVATVSAMDNDEMNSNNSRLDYAITAVVPTTAPGVVLDPFDDVMMHFTFDNSSSQVRIVTNSMLDYEQIVAYMVTVTVSDNGDPSRSGATSFPVRVVDINDNDPVFIFASINASRYYATLRENSPFARPVQFFATDADSGTNALVSFSFTNRSAVPSNVFSIDGSFLNVAGNSLDYEINQSYIFNVTAMDDGIPPRSVIAEVEITVVDENDNSPTFEDRSYSTNVDEGDYTRNTTAILEVNATDADSGALGEITYEVFPANSLFLVTTLPSGAGQLWVLGVLNREANPMHTITLLARDGGVPPNTGTATVTVRVNDINDNAPILSETLYTATIAENNSPGPILLDNNVIATDMDLGTNSDLLYSLSDTSNFEIMENTGEIISLRSFDFEQNSSFILSITVRDNATEYLTDTATLTVTITDENDNVPYFIDFPSDVVHMVYENITQGTVIATIMATDSDSTSNANLVFQLANDEGRFTIDTNGEITLVSSLDRETTDSYNLTVTVSDQGDPVLFTSDYLYIEVVDVNDVPPQLETTSYNFLIAEDVGLNTSLGELLAFDMDNGANGVIEFDIVMGDSNRFTITTTRTGPTSPGDGRQIYAGRIFTNMPFDYETETLYNLRVRARNIVPPYNEDFADVVITIRDINDNAPVFSMPDGYTFRVPEATAVQSPVGTVVATDVDGGLNGTVLYQLSSGTGQTTFSIDRVSGVVTLQSQLDFENIDSYEFTIEAYDRSSVSLTSNVSITVIVQDTNEQAPEFDMVSYSESLMENVRAGALVVQVNATERETGGSTVRYSLVAGTDRFAIDDITGIITTTTSLDREDQSSYVLTVRASDTAVMPLSSFAQVFIEVEDVNDNDPVFEINSTTVRLPESSQIGTTLPETYMASDIDAGVNAIITYSLFPSNIFNVHTTTGVISVVSPESLDREMQSSLLLRLRATDGGGINSRASELLITVQLEDINDNPPVFTQQVYRDITVREGVAEGITVTTVEATDLDLISNFLYTIESGDDFPARKFRVDPATGVIVTTSNTLDRETRDYYELVVAVSDRGTPPRTGTAIVEVTVMDINDNSPICTQPTFQFTVLEANDEEVLLGRVSATDGDSRTDMPPAGSGRLIYLLENSNLQTILRVDPTNGDVFGRDEMLDYEADPFIQFTVRVTDQPEASAGSSRSVRCTGTITLIDTNDNAPVFDMNPYQALISESASIGTLITTVLAEDNDQGTNGMVLYRFRGQSSMFSIDSMTGQVTLTATLDSDISNRHVLDVEAVDQGFPERRNGQAALIIRVTDVDDTSPNFPQSFYDVSISEGAPRDTTVIEVVAVDTDSAVLTYTIIEGNTDDTFRIGSGDGVIQVTKPLDREVVSTYSLIIRAEDSASNRGNTTVRVSLTDVNDEVPRFREMEYTAFVNENSAEGTPVLPVIGNATIAIQAIDQDQPNTPNSRVVYRLEGPDALRFNIDLTSGIVTVARGANLNYEDNRDSAGLTLTVRAFDTSPTDPQNSSVPLTIIVQDVNDMAPVFSRSSGYVIFVSEDLQVGNLITSEVMATDRDTVGGDVRYALTNAIPFSSLGQFTIDRETGDINLMTSLDRETNPSITLVVTASDMGEPALSSVVSVLITVSDVNDNSPQFGQDIFITDVPEFLGIGASAFRVTAVDSDAAGQNSEVIYMLNSTSSFFFINRDTGDITTTQTLDYETQTSHSLDVVACDSSNVLDRRCGSAVVLINIIDFNDEMPEFDQREYRTDLCYDRASAGTDLVQPVATDRDSGTNSALTYSLSQGHSPLFSIAPATGRVSLATSATVVNVGTYSLTVIATDGGASTLSGTALVIINTLNCTDTPFYFESPFQYFVIDEGTNVFADSSVSQEIMISMTASRASFYLDQSTNPFSNTLNNIEIKARQDLLPELRQGNGLDREARALYTVILQAGNNQRSTYTSITLEVRDTNDNRPQFVSDLFVFTVIENTTAPVPVGSVLATDADDGTNGRVEYSILSVIPSSMTSSFIIDANTGAISTNALLDRESNTQVQLEIQASDQLSSDTTTVRVTVEDTNDCDPTFTMQSYAFSFLENLPAGTSVGSVMATDCDEGSNADIRYSITGGSINVFQLDLVSGVITTLNPLDFEQNSQYILTITAMDMGTPTPRSSNVSAYFQVEDFNDCPPVFVNHPTSILITENNQINSVIQTFSVQDCDSGINGVNGTRFSIIRGNEQGTVFEIDEVSGTLTIVDTLDRERQDTYIVSVRAMDSAITNPLFTVTELRVNVLDMNDNDPVFQGSGVVTLTVTEGEDLGQALFTVQAMDADIGDNAEITYFLLGGDGDFTVGPESGELSVARSLDRETVDNYVLTVVGSDISSEPRSSNITIVVQVLDENDNDPTIINIESRVTTVEIPEGLHEGTEVFIINATDLDEGANSFLEFYLDDASNDLPFNITGNVINAYGELDYETQITYFLTVVVEDGGIPNSRRGIATLIVEVTDNNDNSPRFFQAEYTASQSEGAPEGTSITRVGATDDDQVDTPNSIIQYSLSDMDSDAQYFTIDNSTGVIYNNITLDREMVDSYRFRVVARNYLSSSPRSGSTTVIITVEDVNDEVPQFGQQMYGLTLDEGTLTGTTVLTVAATDGDKPNMPNSEIIFSLTRQPNNPFFIIPNTGDLVVHNELDYEESTSYDFEVVVEDKGSPQPQRSTARIMVNLTDINDQRPIFGQTLFSVSVSEGFTASPSQPRLLTSFQYRDADTLPMHTRSSFSVLTVSATGSQTTVPSDLFTATTLVGSTSGELYLNRPLNYEAIQGYSVTIRVQNDELGSGDLCPAQPPCELNSFAIVNLNVLDLNDNSPNFTRQEYKGQISTTALPGASILSVVATDADITPNFNAIEYKLESNPQGRFRIGAATGTLFTLGSFSDLDGSTFTLIVVARDNNGNTPYNEAKSVVSLVVLNDFKRIAITFNANVDVIERKEQEIVSLLRNLTGYEIVVEPYRDFSTDTLTSTFIFHAVDQGQIVDFTQFITKLDTNRTEVFRRLASCNITDIISIAKLDEYIYPTLLDTETIVILVLCLILILGSIILLAVAIRQRYLALHAARHKLLADVFYGSHAGSSIVDNIHHENIELELIETSGQTKKQNPMFVHPYDNWAGVDTSGVEESVGGDSNLQRDNPMYESQEIRMEMFADVSDEDEGDDERDEAELLAAALQEDSDDEAEDNSVTAI